MLVGRRRGENTQSVGGLIFYHQLCKISSYFTMALTLFDALTTLDAVTTGKKAVLVKFTDGHEISLENLYGNFVSYRRGSPREMFADYSQAFRYVTYDIGRRIVFSINTY